MTWLELIGAVGAASLRNRLENAEESDGVARFMLDRLTGPQVVSIVRAILQDTAMASRIRIAMPRGLVDGQGLPEEVVTDDRTVHLRHSESDRAALLIANTDDDQGASLQEVALLGAKQLVEEPRLWVRAACEGLGLPENQQNVWIAALSGLASADDWTLYQVAHYVSLTQQHIADESKPLLAALGWALPALQLPRNSGYFQTLRPQDQETPRRWRRAFEKIVSERKPLLLKMRPPRQVIETEELRAQWEQVKEDVPAHSHSTIEAFIEAPSGWRLQAENLASLEWEIDGVFQLFSGLRAKKMSLPEETAQFFEDELPDRLSESEKEYIEQFKKLKNVREPREEDREFFESHREDIGRDRSLRGKWERFVFGKPIECTDFLSGLLRTLERLYGQAGSLEGRRSIEIRTAKQTKAHWRDVNADVATSFSVRYRGIADLMSGAVKWKTSRLFDFEAFQDEERKRKKYRRNESTSRTSRQIKFDITLKIGDGAIADETTVQLIWTCDLNVIGVEQFADMARLERKPLVKSVVARQTVSRKGTLQSVSLRDVSTLQAAFRQDSGSLISRTDTAEDVAKSFPSALDKARASGRILPEGVAAIDLAFKAFAECYSTAIKEWRAKGVASPILFVQAQRYGELLNGLSAHASSDLNRQELWEPVLAIGCIPVLGGAPSAVVAPWHPLRLAAAAAKARSVAGLFAHVLTASEVNFGGADARLFFNDLVSEMAHPYYPEVAVGFSGTEPVLLGETDTLNGYSLMERPVRDSLEASTDVDPREAARQIRDLAGRYVELQPHERANLSVMLYNCDSASLAIETVSALDSSEDDEDIRCDIVIKHRDRPKLSRLYSELLERAEQDPDALVISETSRNFMSKLRIGVMLEGSAPAQGVTRPIDIAFLHDVVSRQAKEDWFTVDKPTTPISLLESVPARWSYKRVTAEDELKATSYLACPRQPMEGWAYLDAVGAVIRRQSHDASKHILPARQISFQDQTLKFMFEEVHGLAEWVATYDDLLDKRQLAAQGINVIRYRRQRTHGRNMIVSSTSELRVLNVLVLRRLNELNLGLSQERLAALAQRMIGDALRISGDIVLRAAKSGISAGELIGLVLSHALAAEEFGPQESVAWFLLDDYAQWLGQREQGIADILALSVCPNEAHGHALRAIVTEAKYVLSNGASEARRTSKQQLRQTVSRIEDALFGDPGRLDRDLWLSRISNLLLDGTTAMGFSGALEKARDGIRNGTMPIDLRGYSHIFISGPADDAGGVPEQEVIGDMSQGLQEVFDRNTLRTLVKAYEEKSSLKAVRASLGDERSWERSQFRQPAVRVNWHKGIATNVAPAAEDTSRGPTNRPATTAPVASTRASEVESHANDSASEAPVTQSSGTGLAALVSIRASQQSVASEGDQQWLENTAKKLRGALLGYGLQAKVLGTRLTPNAALIRFLGSDQLRIEAIESQQSALLTTHGLRVVAISPLPGEIVIAIARPQRQVVSLWDVWHRRELNRNAAGLNTSFVLGLRELDGEILYLNLGSAFGGAQQHEPHSLIAGATGSGKSVLIQALIMDIAATNPSHLARIHLIDPKMGVDYSAIERLPHLGGEIVSDQARATQVMQNLVAEMDRRYELFKTHRARDLGTFNAKVDPQMRLPMVFLVHDEFAEWMLTETYKDAVSTIVQRLGVKARAAGIHLIFAAQRPDVQVMPIQLRDNLGNRLILKVSSVGTSELSLGVKGAESLLGLGHLAARLNGEPGGIVFAQAPFLSDQDLEDAVTAIAGEEAARKAQKETAPAIAAG